MVDLVEFFEKDLEAFPSYRWLMLANSALIAFSMFANVFSFPPILDIIKQDLGFTYAQGGLLFSAPLLFITILAIPGGSIADRIGIRRAAGIGSLLVALGGILRGFSTSFLVFVLLTALIGAGIGLIYPNLPKVISTWFPRRFGGIATSIYGLGIVLGASVPMAVTYPALFQIGGSWSGALIIWGFITLIVSAAWWVLARDRQASLDEGRPVAVLEKRDHLSIWRNRNILVITGIFFLNAVTFYVGTGWFVGFLSEKAVFIEEAILIASFFPAGSIPAIFLLPFFSDRLGMRRPFFWVSMVISVVFLYLLLVASKSYFWLILGILGFFTSAPFIFCFILPVELVPSSSVGRASGIMLSIGYLGSFIGPWLVGYLKDVTGSFLPLVAVEIATCIGVIILIFLIPETGWRGRRTSIKVDTTIITSKPEEN